MKALSIITAYLIFLPFIFSQEEILSYNININVETSGDLLVEEKITVRAEGNQIQRGIYRSFPTSYKDKIGTRFKVGFEVLKVLKNNETEPYFIKNKSNGKVVYIGKEDVFLSPGIYTYTLKYKTTRQIGFFKEFDELYFNAIGGDWNFNIKSAAVTITLPNKAKILNLKAYSGIEGARNCNCEYESNQNTASIKTTKILYPAEQLTFAISWPKGIVKEPTSTEKWLYFLTSNLHVIFVIIALIVVFIFYYSAWKKVGVDPPKGTIIPLFDPPQGFSPAEVAMLHKQGMTKNALTATIVNLAVKGHININYSGKIYTLTKINADLNQLSETDKTVLQALLGNKNTLKLENSNHSTFSTAQSHLSSTIKNKLTPKYFSFNYKHLTLGILASVISGIISFIIAPSPVIPILFVILMVIMVIIFTFLIKAPTVKGRQIMDDIEGFKMYVKVAEVDRLNAQHAPEITPQRFEALLPYAIAIDVENQWGKKFEKALANSVKENANYQPSWYMGPSFGHSFAASQFTNSFSNSFSSAISSASTPPGSSSGSGGGGFSGGGGGGGGGGGW